MNSLTPWGFADFIYEIFFSLENIEKAILDVNIDGRQIDIIATEKRAKENEHPIEWIVEIKKYKSLVNLGIIEQFYVKSLSIQIPNTKLIFVTSSSLTKSAQAFAQKNGILVWGLREIFEKVTDEFLISYFSTDRQNKNQFESSTESSKEDNLISLLQSIDSGKSNWPNYQSLVFDILEFLFCPSLEIPHYELADLDSRNRRDIIFENDADEGFWKSMREIYDAYYVVVDAKNYSNPLSKRPIIDIAYYLKPYGCGMFGIIVCRNGTNSAAEHAIKEQWIGGRKMIVVLSDEDLIEMLELKKNSGNPEGVIRRKIANFRMRL